MFIDRKEELSLLEKIYRSGKAELFVLYGRRRVGKTELLRTFCAEKPHLFFVATLSSDREQLTSFSQHIWRFTHRDAPEGFSFPSWEAAFQALADLPGRPIVILDEFTYLIQENKSIPSILQKVWDERLGRSQICLILCGSYIGLMESEVLGYRAALYGRRTGSYLLSPLEIDQAVLFFPHYSDLEKIEAWSILGGQPYYLQCFSDQQDIFTNIRCQILDQKGVLYHEPYLLLMEELREPRSYFAVLRAIAEGRTRMSEITQAANFSSPTATSRYLDILREMRIVDRIVPISETQPEKSKKGIYQITDPFLRFYFRFVHPNKGSLDLGLTEAVLNQKVTPYFNHFVASRFEDAAREYVTRLARRGSFPIVDRIGKWWDREVEIDLVAISSQERKLWIGECKWSEKAVGTNVYADLRQKSQSLLSLGLADSVQYILFSKSGFTEALQNLAQEEEILLVDASQVISESES